MHFNEKSLLLWFASNGCWFKTAVWEFEFCLMADQPLWIIKCQKGYIGFVFCVCFGVWGIGFCYMFYLIRFWWKDWFLLEISRFPLVWCFWRGPLSCLSGSILGKFIETFHSLWECIWLWGVFSMLSILMWDLPFLGGWVCTVGVVNMKWGEYKFFFIILSKASWLLTYDILYMRELILCLIIPRFLQFLMYEFINDWF